VSALDAAQARAWVDGFVAAIDAHHAELGELDRRSGDGDFGTNLRSAARRLTAGLEAAPATVGGPFAAASAAFMATGGTSGPLLGMWFRALAQAGGDAEAISAPDLAAAMATGNASIMRLGGAQVGDKTMLDAFVPAADALAAAAGEDIGVALTRAAEAADAGADRTADLEARLGRSSYVGDAALGVPDPGARAVALLLHCGAQAASAPTPKETNA
jgi:phosphoenolpyruvate---glycerone phosphotransferase subunit DhaL